MSDHNPIYHLKDAYFFEVPKALWSRSWQTHRRGARVPSRPYERDHLPMPSVAEFNEAMAGKILIPQPFGTLDSLYEKKSGFCISKYMLLELLLAGILLLLFSRLAKRLRSGEPPKGAFANLFESMILFVRDQIARPAIDSHDHGHDDHGDAHHGHESHDGHGHGTPALAGAGGPAVARPPRSARRRPVRAAPAHALLLRARLQPARHGALGGLADGVVLRHARPGGRHVPDGRGGRHAEVRRSSASSRIRCRRWTCRCRWRSCSSR